MVNAPGTTYTGTVDGTHLNSISLPFPQGISSPPGRSLGTQGTQEFLTQTIQSITEVNRDHNPQGYVQQWNLTVERQLPAGFSLSAAYVGSKGTHLQQYSLQMDQISDNLLAQAANQYGTGGKSAVTLLQAVPEFFFINGQALALAAPTTTVGQLLLGRTIRNTPASNWPDKDRSILSITPCKSPRRDDSRGPALCSWPIRMPNLSATPIRSHHGWRLAWAEFKTTTLKGERSLSSQDVPQRLVISYVLEWPFGQGRKYLANAGRALNSLVGNWGIDGVTTFQRGFPLVFGNGQANDAALFGARSWPNVIAGCDKAKGGARITRLNGWFDAACFTAPADFTFGNESRVDATLRSDGVNNFDFAVFRSFCFDPRAELVLSPESSFSICSIGRNLRRPIQLVVRKTMRRSDSLPARHKDQSTPDSICAEIILLTGHEPCGSIRRKRFASSQVAA